MLLVVNLYTIHYMMKRLTLLVSMLYDSMMLHYRYYKHTITIHQNWLAAIGSLARWRSLDMRRIIMGQQEDDSRQQFGF